MPAPSTTTPRSSNAAPATSILAAGRSRPTPITTLLGSCVAVCLYDPKLRLAGHEPFPAAQSLQDGRRRFRRDSGRRLFDGSAAQHHAQQGRAKQRIVAKAFGGGTIVTSILMAIGQRNADFAKEWLDREGIPLAAQDFGGAWSRKVMFTPDGGDAYCRRLPISQPGVQDVVKAERDYEQSLIRPASPGRKEDRAVLRTMP
jgi:chemotaxis protein CheD